MTLTDSHVNGNGASRDFESFVEQQAAALREQLAVEDHNREQLRDRLAELTERVERLRGALSALEGQPAELTAGPAAASGPTRKWKISEAKMLEVRAFILKRHSDGSAFTAHQLVVEGAGAARSTVLQAIHMLRERDELRVAAAVQGGGHSYALMPELLDA